MKPWGYILVTCGVLLPICILVVLMLKIGNEHDKAEAACVDRGGVLMEARNLRVCVDPKIFK